MNRWMSTTEAAETWAEAWIIEQQIRRERDEEERRRRAYLELPLPEPSPIDERPPANERPIGSHVIIIEL